MAWTRSALTRSLALVASVAVVLVSAQERGAWFWAGVALVVVNVIGLLVSRSRTGHGPRPGTSGRPGARVLDGQDEGRGSQRLGELLSLPGVAAAFAAGPEMWRQVDYLEVTQVGPTTAEELAAFVWLENDQGWAIALGDEVKPYLALDVDEEDDPVIGVLRGHPAVEDAFHEDREVYRVEQRGPIGVDEFAELAARALVAHHLRAAARA